MTPAQMAEIHGASFTTPRPWSEAELDDLNTSPLCYVASSENGFAIIRKAGPEAELLTIAVHPDARRTGIGSTLLFAVLKDAKDADCEDIFLEVVATNEPAIALYRAAGFDELNYRKDYYTGPGGEKLAALVMHKSL